MKERLSHRNYLRTILAGIIFFSISLLFTPDYSFEQSQPPLGKIRNVSRNFLGQQEIIVQIPGAYRRVRMGDRVYVKIGEKIAVMEVSFPMGSVARCRILWRYRRLFPELRAGQPVFRYVRGIEESLASNKKKVVQPELIQEQPCSPGITDVGISIVAPWVAINNDPKCKYFQLTLLKGKTKSIKGLEIDLLTFFNETESVRGVQIGAGFIFNKIEEDMKGLQILAGIMGGAITGRDVSGIQVSAQFLGNITFTGRDTSGLQLSAGIVQGFNATGRDLDGFHVTGGIGAFNSAERKVNGGQIALGGLSVSESGYQLRGLQLTIGVIASSSSVGTSFIYDALRKDFSKKSKKSNGDNQGGIKGEHNPVRENHTGDMQDEIVFPPSSGVQLTGGMIIAQNYTRGDFSGMQLAVGIASFNRVRGSFSGVELAIAGNFVSRNFSGFQLGLVNTVGTGAVSATNPEEYTMSGLQLGLLNYSLHNRGFQVGGVNVSGTCRFQVGIFNWSSGDALFQLGLVNYCGKKATFQLGLINIAMENTIPVFPIINIGF